jgi:hypothetical protein
MAERWRPDVLLSEDIRALQIRGRIRSRLLAAYFPTSPRQREKIAVAAEQLVEGGWGTPEGVVDGLLQLVMAYGPTPAEEAKP